MVVQEENQSRLQKLQWTYYSLLLFLLLPLLRRHPAKPVKATKPVHNQDGSTVVAKKVPLALNTDKSKEVTSKDHKDMDYDDSEVGPK